MSIDFSQEKKITERKIRKFTDKGLTIPKDLLSYYNNLSEGSSSGSGGGLTQAQAQAAFEAALQNQSQADFEDFVFTDANNITFIRRTILNEETGVFTASLLNVDGTPAVVTPSPPLVVAAARSPVIEVIRHYATASGSGFSQADVLLKTIQANGQVSWFNETTNLFLTSNPSATSVSQNIGDASITSAVIDVISPAASSTVFQTGSTPGLTQNIEVPTVCGRKANYLTIFHVSGVASNLALYASKGIGLSQLLIPSQNPAFGTSSPSTATANYFLDENHTHIHLRKWQVGSQSIQIVWRYLEGSSKNFIEAQRSKVGVAYSVANQTALTSVGFDTPVRIFQGQAYFTFIGNTTNISLKYQIRQTINSINTWFTLAEMVLPSTLNSAVLIIPSHGISATRFEFTGTFTSYNYLVTLNNAE